MRVRYEAFMQNLSENLKGREHSEDLGEDGKLVLTGSLGNRVESCGLDASGSG